MNGRPTTLDPRSGSAVGAAPRADPAVKVACLVACVLAVVATPPRAVWAFGAYAVLLMAAVRVTRLPIPVLVRRLVIDLPFVLFAVALPIVGTGPRQSVLGISLSVTGAWAAWGIVAKATLGTGAAVVLSWTTPVPDLLAGLDRLRVPRALTAIGGFMVRYLEVTAGELRRLQIARVSRADDPRWLWQGRAVAATAGTLVVRSFERGERVHHAMLARGFAGRFPPVVSSGPAVSSWPDALWPAVLWPVGAGCISALALLTT